MKSTVAIHQPSYFPWLGLLDKIARCNTFIILDSVQYNKRAFLNRTLYSTDDGIRYISLPVSSKGHQVNNLLIRDAIISDPKIFNKHLETLRYRYGKRRGWESLYPELQLIFNREDQSLLSLNIDLLMLTLGRFGISPKIYLASQLEAFGVKSELISNLTKAVKGDCYISGAGALDYMDRSIFESAGIKLEVQQFTHPAYSQSHSKPFQPGCFALEWIIEDPAEAKNKFRKHLYATGIQKPLCLDD